MAADSQQGRGPCRFLPIRFCAVEPRQPREPPSQALPIPAYQGTTVGMASAPTPWWAWAWPALAWAILLAMPLAGAGGLIAAAARVGLVATLVAALHHAQGVADRLGEPV